MTPEERQEIETPLTRRVRATHRMNEQATLRCIADGEVWPCAAARLLADYDHLVEVAREVRGWLSNPEWPVFGPGIGRGPLDPGRMAARSAVEQVLALIDPATPEPDR